MGKQSASNRRFSLILSIHCSTVRRRDYPNRGHWTTPGNNLCHQKQQTSRSYITHHRIDRLLNSILLVWLYAPTSVLLLFPPMGTSKSSKQWCKRNGRSSSLSDRHACFRWTICRESRIHFRCNCTPDLASFQLSLHQPRLSS